MSMTKQEMAQLVVDELKAVKDNARSYMDEEDEPSNSEVDAFRNGAFAAYHKIADKLESVVDGELKRLPTHEHEDSDDEDD